MLEIGDDTLQLLQAAILLLDLATQSPDFIMKIIAILVGIGKIAVRRFEWSR